MTMQPVEEEIVPPEIYTAFQKMKARDYEGAENLLKSGLQEVEASHNQTQQALFCSTLGVVARLKGDTKEAWRYYVRAEKLLPKDPSLKIIMAKLLMEQFSQHESAIKKLQAVLKLAKGSAAFEHNAQALLAMAYLRKGDKKKATQFLELSMANDFCQISLAEHLNFEVLEAFLSRNFQVSLCRQYVEKALTLARRGQEEKPIRFLTKLLEGFEVTLQ